MYIENRRLNASARVPQNSEMTDKAKHSIVCEFVIYRWFLPSCFAHPEFYSLTKNNYLGEGKDRRDLNSCFSKLFLGMMKGAPPNYHPSIDVGVIARFVKEHEPKVRRFFNALLDIELDPECIADTGPAPGQKDKILQFDSICVSLSAVSDIFHTIESNLPSSRKSRPG